MAPIGNINMVDATGRPTQKMISFYRERAKGGTGLIITGLVPVSFGIDSTLSEDNDTTYFPRIDGTSRTRLSGWMDLTSAIKPYGSKIFIQLSAGLGRVGSPEPFLKGKILRSASINKNYYVPQVPHLPLSDRKIRKIVKSFGQCAINAKVCGFDGIHLHGHEGYLMDQLTSSPWNRRRIGRYKNKFQFAIDVVNEIKKRCGKEFPIIYRLDLTQALEESYGKEFFKKQFHGKERSIEEGLELCKALHGAGVDAFDVDKGCYDNWFWPHPPAYFDDAIYAEELAGRLKSYFKKESIDAKVIAVGKLGKPEVAEEVLKREWADLVMLGRPLIADPFWTKKVIEGNISEIVHCIGDQDACLESLKRSGHLCCSVNPYAGFEDCKTLMKTSNQKTVAVIGAGPAGCEAAMTAHARGHRVTLFEKTDHIGGQLFLAGKMNIKHDIRRYLSNLQHRLNKSIESGMEVELNKEISAEDVANDFDILFCCNGLKPSIPDIEGIKTIEHKEIRTFLENDMEITEGTKDILIIGGGSIGCEVAYSIACKKKLNVTIVGKNQYLMPRTAAANRSHLLWMMMGKGSTSGKREDILENPITAYNASKVVRISGNTVYIDVNRDRDDPYLPWKPLIPENIKNPFEKKLKAENVEQITLHADLILFATSGIANSDLFYELTEIEPTREIYALGDCDRPEDLWKAVTNANEVARNI